MKFKEAKEVAIGLRERVFSYFGLPYILHSDNGREFVNSVIVDTINIWPGECKIVNGKPRSFWIKLCWKKQPLVGDNNHSKTTRG